MFHITEFCNVLTENIIYISISIMHYRSDLMNIDKHIDKAKRLQSPMEKLNIESD